MNMQHNDDKLENTNTRNSVLFENFESRYIVRRVIQYTSSGRILEVYDLQLEKIVSIKEIQLLNMNKLNEYECIDE